MTLGFAILVVCVVRFVMTWSSGTMFYLSILVLQLFELDMTLTCALPPMDYPTGTSVVTLH